MIHLAGIDYGSKMAGTTVIAILKKTEVSLFQSEKKQDADALIYEVIKQETCPHVFIDAPLSLPGVYHLGAAYESYFYRSCDSALSAMSPMFLGGLTARAMQLKARLEQLGTKVYETYPGGLARQLNLKERHYKQQLSELPALREHLASLLPFAIPLAEITTWHHFDAILALWSAWRFNQQTHDSYGDPKEGLIVI